MIEAANKQIKYHFLCRKEILNVEQLKNHLQQAIKDYNYRPHDVLKGPTPTEFPIGKLPVQVSFENEIANAKVARLIENKTSKCYS